MSRLVTPETPRPKTILDLIEYSYGDAGKKLTWPKGPARAHG